MRRERRCSRGRQAPAEAASASTRIGRATPSRAADRHPGQGDRHLHLRPERPRAGDAARPDRAAARPGRLRCRRDPMPSSVDASSIAHIPNVQVVQKGNFLGVVAPQEYDAIQAAAQLKVTWAPMPPILPGERRPVRARCGSRTAAGQIAGEVRGQHGQRRRRRSRRRRTDRQPQTYKYPYNGARADRPELLPSPTSTRERARSIYSNTQDIYGARGRTIATALTRPAARPIQRPGDLLRGLELVRQRHDPRRLRRGGGVHVAGRRQAGARAVHALGRARLGQLRPGDDVRRPRRHRRQRQHRRRSTTRGCPVLAARLRRRRPSSLSGSRSTAPSSTGRRRRHEQHRHAVQRSRTAACTCKSVPR